MTNGSDRLDRMERILERMAEAQQSAISLQGQQQEQIRILTNAVQTELYSSADHAARLARQDALIERLDAIIERLVYREGRDGNGEQSQ